MASYTITPQYIPNGTDRQITIVGAAPLSTVTLQDNFNLTGLQPPGILGTTDSSGNFSWTGVGFLWGSNTRNIAELSVGSGIVLTIIEYPTPAVTFNSNNYAYGQSRTMNVYGASPLMPVIFGRVGMPSGFVSSETHGTTDANGNCTYVDTQGTWYISGIEDTYEIITIKVNGIQIGSPIILSNSTPPSTVSFNLTGYTFGQTRIMTITGAYPNSPVSFNREGLPSGFLSTSIHGTTDANGNLVYTDTQGTWGTDTSEVITITAGGLQVGSPQHLSNGPSGSSSGSAIVTDGANISMYGRNVTNGQLLVTSPPTVATGTGSFDPIISPNGKFAYVIAGSASDTLYQYQVDLTTNLLTPLSPATIALGFTASAMCISPDGTSLYVLVKSTVIPYPSLVNQYAVDPVTGLVTALSPSQATTPGPIIVPSPGGAGTVYLNDLAIACSLDGLSVYVTAVQNGYLTPQGIYVYSRSPITGLLTLGTFTWIETSTGAPFDITGFCVSTVGLFIINGDSAKVYGPVNTTGGRVLAPAEFMYMSPGDPKKAIVSSDSVYVYVICTTSNMLFQWHNNGSIWVSNSISTGGVPIAMALSSDNNFIYVVTDAGVVMEFGIDPVTGVMTALSPSSVATDGTGSGIALSSFTPPPPVPPAPINAVLLSPIFNGEQFFDNDGNMLAGGLVFTYVAGSFSTLATTYTTISGQVANSDPIVLDSSGRLPTEIWLTEGLSYNLVLTLPDGSTVLTFVDQVVGTLPVEVSASGSNTLWNAETSTITYVNGTNFLVAGNHVLDFAVGNRVELQVATGYIYGTVSAVTFGSGNTQVTIIPDTVNIDSSLTTAAWSALTTTAIAIDAGAVSYDSTLAYANANTVGGELKIVETQGTALYNELANEELVQLTTCTDGLTYVFTPAFPSVSYTKNQEWKVCFNMASVSGAPTFNVSGIGSLPLLQYNSAGATMPATISAGLVSDVMYNGYNMILVDSLPTPAGAFIPTVTITQATPGPIGYESYPATLAGVGPVTMIRCFGRTSVVTSSGGNGNTTITLPIPIPTQVLSARVSNGTAWGGSAVSVFALMPTLPAGATTFIIGYYAPAAATWYFDWEVTGY